ncbi:MAG: hypothetical protein WBE63_21040, partial [Acidobacteriaceae bacterium]
MGAPAEEGWERIYHDELGSPRGFLGWIVAVDPWAVEAIPVPGEGDRGEGVVSRNGKGRYFGAEDGVNLIDDDAGRSVCWLLWGEP